MADIIRNPDITPEMTKTLAGRAWFVFSVNLGDQFSIEGMCGNEYDIAGEGVSVLDEILGAYAKFPRGIFKLDYGGLVQDVREVGSDNIKDLKAAYIAIYGNVNRPNVWDPVENPWGPVGNVDGT